MISRRDYFKLVVASGVSGFISGPLAKNTNIWDVIVIGSGVAGLSASASALEQNASKVLLLEKGPLIGGHSIYSSGSIAAVAPSRCKCDKEKETVEQFVENALSIGGGLGNREVLTKIGKDSEKILSWLEDIGIYFGPAYVAYSGLNSRSWSMPGNSAGRSYVIALASYVQKLGGKILLSSKVTGISKSNGTWIVHIGSQRLLTKSVVIASGGFTANVKERMKINPLLTASISTSANPDNTRFDGATGEMIFFAENLGAKIARGFGLQVLPFWGGRLLDYIGADIYVDSSGKRFVNENLPWNSISEAILKFPERQCFVITDSQSYKGATLGVKLINKIIKKADSVEAMAKDMGIDKKTLIETIENYNRAVDLGKDLLTGKEYFRQKIEKPPFYWGRETIYVHTTLDGIVTDDEAKVVSMRGGIISGLFAAGETVGGIFGKDRLGGAGMTACFVMGKEAGKQAAIYARNN